MGTDADLEPEVIRALACLEVARRAADRYVIQHLGLSLSVDMRRVARTEVRKRDWRGALVSVLDLRRRVAEAAALLLRVLLRFLRLLLELLGPLVVEDGTEPAPEPLELLLTRARQLDLPPPSLLVVPRERLVA
jgi:hypothetical protein